MARIFLLVLLALSLWPSRATAGVPAHAAPETGRVTAPSADYAHEAVRSHGGLELVRRLEGRSPGGAGRLPVESLLAPGYLLVAARVGLRSPGPGESALDSVTPLCERLPYYATAPPLPR